MKILWLNSEITLLQETTKRLYFGCEIVLPRLVTSVTTDPEGNVFGWGVILDQDIDNGEWTSVEICEFLAKVDLEGLDWRTTWMTI